VLVFLSGVGLLIAAINILNLMLIRIIKHTKSIGIMRALGSTRRGILRQFMNESALMCVVGALIGTAISPQVYRLLQTVFVSSEGFASQTFGLDLMAGAAVGLLFSLVFGLYPAFLAKNTDATLAIRAE
jgi:putative ABC transport system permease protein